MASNRLFLSAVHGHISGQASRGYTCSEKYDWQNLSLHQSGQSAREQPYHVATQHFPLHMSSRVKDSVSATEISPMSRCFDLHRTGGEIVNNRCCSFAMCGVKRSERSPPCDHVRHHAKGAGRQIRQAGSCRKIFSEIDAACHWSYMRNFHSPNKHDSHSREDPIFNVSVRTSHGRSRRRDEILRARPKRPIDEFHPIHHEQLELYPNEDFHESLDSSRNFRNTNNGKMVKRKCIKQGFRKNIYNGARASKYGRNSCQERNADHLGGKKAMKNVDCEDKSKRLCCPNELDQQPPVESDRMRNGSREGNAEITKLVGQNGAKGNCNPKKNALTAPALSGSTKCDENSNMLSPKYSNKTIASSNTPKLSEGSNDMELESDKQYNVNGCTERGTLQHLPVTHTEKSVQPTESDNLSHAEVLRRDCLNLWRARRLRKDSAAVADKIVKVDQQTVHRSKVSTSGRVRNGRPATCASSESNDEDDSASKSSDQFSTATSLEGLQKCGEVRANKKLQQSLRFPSSCKCNQSSQNTTAEKELMCTLELPPEANPGEIAHQKKEEKLLWCQVSTDHPYAKVQVSWNGSDTSKVEQAAGSLCDKSAHQNISQQESNNDNLDAGSKGTLGVRCEKKAEGNGAKWDEQIYSLCTGSTLLDQKTVARCSMHGILKVNSPKSPNHESGTTPFDGSILDRGAVNKCQKKPVNRSSQSYCSDFKNWLNRSDCRDNQQETMNLNILRKKQECSALAASGNEVNQKAAKEDCQPQALRVTSNQQISHHCVTDTINSGTANRGDRIPCSSIPDLNFLPGMIGDEDFVAPKDPVCQVTADGFKPQSVTESISASLTGPIVKEEQFKQAEPNQLIREVCGKGASEAANQLQISDSNTGPPLRSTVEESSPSIDAFKSALCEFIKNIVKPLWEDGLLSREVHKIVVKKAVEKVAVTWASSAPATEMAICRILSDESKNIEQLVQGYLDMYVGKEVLKRITPGLVSERSCKTPCSSDANFVERRGTTMIGEDPQKRNGELRIGEGSNYLSLAVLLNADFEA
ncbi:uncharacterized protein LOC133910650 [Phragmites australis]|uniref:uncharacterized protein LOC133910650 n=1 Tax=Phragmites australis TaxID=29695 RepID=UPI002D79EDD1|nr:uncharacterized protein LOC133910650 [Phragmites australis]